MRILGFDITRAEKTKDLSAVTENRGGWFRILESFAGAWQNNVEIEFDSVLSFHAVYACVTLIASDIAKLQVRLLSLGTNGIWTETKNPAFSPVLRKPNKYQNRIQFWECYFLSKLLRGNVYVLKRRDARQVVVGLYILDPNRVRPLVSDSGEVFYQLMSDNLSELIEASTVVPASEIIHDRFNCLFHPLIGTSPIFACGLAATQGLNIQQNSTKFFQNYAVPSGMLLAPGAISDETAQRLKDKWEAGYSGKAGAGKIAVLGDNLKFEPMTMKSVDAQLIEQLKWTAEVVCSVFHVPPYKVGVGPMPALNNVQALNVEYYSQGLQSLIEAAEICLDEGLKLGETLGVEFDVDGLLRMDSITQMEVIDKGKNTFTPNEGRRRFNLPPVEGGDTVYRQQQDYSIAALAKRDAKEDPFNTSAPKPEPNPPPEDDDDEKENVTDKFLIIYNRKRQEVFRHV